MKHILHIFAAFALLLAAAGCRQTDVRTARVEVPTVINAACEKRVRAALAPLAGGDPQRPAVHLDTLAVTNGVLTVRYDSMMLGLKNIEHAIKDAGFAANEFPPDPEALKKLPQECLPPAKAQ